MPIGAGVSMAGELKMEWERELARREVQPEKKPNSKLNEEMENRQEKKTVRQNRYVIFWDATHHQLPKRISAISYTAHCLNCARLWVPSESTDATELWKMFGTVSISIFDLLWPGNALSRIVARDNTPPNVVPLLRPFHVANKRRAMRFSFRSFFFYIYFFYFSSGLLLIHNDTLLQALVHSSGEKKKFNNEGERESGRGKKTPINLKWSVEKSTRRTTSAGKIQKSWILN